MEEAGVDDLQLSEPRLDAIQHTQDEALFEKPASDAPARALIALYRRYRPDTFAEVIGQEHVTEPLQRALTNNRVNHAYLFSGPRGCGKTTSARILARALNCEKGPRAVPCGECQSCRDLARNGPGSIDVIEIDAASHGGVDDARDLRERAFFAPVSSRFKIYIVDEAHMVTTAGFNALLKLVEEPPPHVKFVFATTEPDKVIGTIRSRTHHYPFRLVPPRLLTEYLATICAAEGISVEPAVLPLVVRAGAGSVRDSLSVLDQLLGGADESGVSYRQAAALLGYTPDSLLDEFVDAFAAGDAGGVFACVDKVIEVGQDPRRFAEDLLRRLRDLVIVAAVPDALTSGLVDVAPDQAERLTSQAAALGAGELTRAAEVIAAGLTDMRGTTAPRLHLELMCARVLLPGADVDDRGLHARLDRLERRIGITEGPSTSANPSSSKGSPRSSTRSDPPATRSDPPASRHESPGSHDEPSTQRPEPSTLRPEPSTLRPEPVEGQAERASTSSALIVESSTPHTASATLRSEPPTLRPELVEGRQPPSTSPAGTPPPTVSAEVPQLSVTDVRRLWPEVLEEVKGKRRFTWILLSQNAQVAELRNGTLLLAMSNAGARDSFARGGNEDVLREAIVVVIGADFAIETMVDPGASQPPAGSRTPQTARTPATGPAAPDPAAAHATNGAQNAVAEDPDEAASRDDSDVTEDQQSHTELLARHLGAEIIAEEDHGA